MYFLTYIYFSLLGFVVIQAFHFPLKTIPIRSQIFLLSKNDDNRKHNHIQSESPNANILCKLTGLAIGLGVSFKILDDLPRGFYRSNLISCENNNLTSKVNINAGEYIGFYPGFKRTIQQVNSSKSNEESLLRAYHHIWKLDASYVLDPTDRNGNILPSLSYLDGLIRVPTSLSHIEEGKIPNIKMLNCFDKFILFQTISPIKIGDKLIIASRDCLLNKQKIQEVSFVTNNSLENSSTIIDSAKEDISVDESEKKFSLLTEKFQSFSDNDVIKIMSQLHEAVSSTNNENDKPL